MTVTTTSPVGLVLASSLAPERLADAARLGESLGFGELWLPEDYFFTGGIAGAATILDATERVPVGIGVVSALARHPAVLAMELATLARVHPGRIVPGIGLGAPAWIEQMGLKPKSPLSAMRECVTVVRRLLAGETVTESGRCFELVDVSLTHPVDGLVPLYLGVIAPKGLALGGEIADGMVGSVLASAEYVRWARERIAEGAAAAGRNPAEHRFVTFALYSVDADPVKAREAVRNTVAFYLAAVPKSTLVEAYGIVEPLAELLEGGAERVAAEMPAQWLEDLAIAGTPDECVEKIQRLRDAGADGVMLCPVPSSETEAIIELTAREVLPNING